MINFAKTEQISKTMFMPFVMLSMISIMTCGCSTIQTNRYPEPKIIAVRNDSGISLSVVTLSEVRNSDDTQIMRGSVSPVPRGATQVFKRPSSAPPLPARIIIS